MATKAIVCIDKKFKKSKKWIRIIECPRSISEQAPKTKSWENHS